MYNFTALKYNGEETLQSLKEQEVLKREYFAMLNSWLK